MDKNEVINALISALLGCKGYIQELNPSDKAIIEEIDTIIYSVQLLRAKSAPKKASLH